MEECQASNLEVVGSSPTILAGLIKAERLGM
jgi:hypothetical protein